MAFFGQPNTRFFHLGQSLNFISFPGALCCHQSGSSGSPNCAHILRVKAGFGIGLSPRFLALPLFGDSMSLTVILVFIQDTGLLTIIRTIPTAYTICLKSQKETSYSKQIVDLCALTFSSQSLVEKIALICAWFLMFCSVWNADLRFLSIISYLG